MFLYSMSLIWLHTFSDVSYVHLYFYFVFVILFCCYISFPVFCVLSYGFAIDVLQLKLRLSIYLCLKWLVPERWHPALRHGPVWDVDMRLLAWHPTLEIKDDRWNNVHLRQICFRRKISIFTVYSPNFQTRLLQTTTPLPKNRPMTQLKCKNKIH